MRIPSTPALRRKILARTVALALLAAPLTLLHRSRPAIPVETFETRYLEPGELLLHAARSDRSDAQVSFQLPAATVFAALVRTRWPWVRRNWTALLMAASTSLVASAAAVVLAPPWALASVVWWLVLFVTKPNTFSYPQSFYSLLFLIVCGLAMWRARRPTVGRSAALATALGATLLFRSPLAFLPPLFALESLLRRVPRRKSQAAIFLIVPCLFLAPWITFNWRVHHRFIPLEAGEANNNVVGGALGRVIATDPTPEIESLVGGPVALLDSRVVLPWAAREVLRHPFRYAAAFIRRLAAVFAMYPWLLGVSLISAVVNRDRPEIAAIAGLIAYFIGVHCLMTILPYYFEPIRAPGIILGAALAARIWGAASASRPPPAIAAGLAGLLTATGASVALAAFVIFCALRYADTPASPDPAEAIDAAFQRQTEDSWLLASRAQARLNEGLTRAAVSDYERAEERDPSSLTLSLAAAAAREEAGEPDALLAWQPGRPTAAREDEPLLAAVLKTRVWLERGRPGRAREELSAALSARPPGNCALAETEESLGWEPLRFICRARSDLDRGLPAEEKIERAEFLMRQGLEWEGIAIDRQNHGDLDGALKVLHRMTQRYPHLAELWSDRAVCELSAGDRPAGIADAKRALALDPAFASASLTLGALYSQTGRRQEALRVLAEARSRAPRPPYDALLREAQAELKIRK